MSTDQCWITLTTPKIAKKYVTFLSIFTFLGYVASDIMEGVRTGEKLFLAAKTTATPSKKAKKQ